MMRSKCPDKRVLTAVVVHDALAPDMVRQCAWEAEVAAQEHWAADGRVLIPVSVRVRGVDRHRRCAAVPHLVQESEDGRSVVGGSQCCFERFVGGPGSACSRRRSQSRQPR